MATSGWVIGAAIVSAIAVTASSISASAAAEASEEAQSQSVRTQSLSTQLKLQTQKGKEAQKVNEELSAQQVEMDAKGLSLASPSFNAIQVHTFNNTAHALHNNTVASKISSLNAESELDSIRRQGSARQSSIFFGAVGQLASIGTSFSSSSQLSSQAASQAGKTAGTAKELSEIEKKMRRLRAGSDFMQGKFVPEDLV